MRIVVIANDELKQEMLSGQMNTTMTTEWINDLHLVPEKADIIIDLLFDTDRINRKQKVVVVEIINYSTNMIC